MSYHIYGIGNALVDQEYQVQDEFFRQAGIQKGVMTLINEEQMHQLRANLQAKYQPQKQACGGSAANTIIGASYFGAKTFYTCNVAADADGDFYAQDLKAAGVDSNINGHRDQGETGKCTVMISPDAERTMNTFLGITSDLHEKHINEQALAASQYVYIEGYLVTSDTSRQAAIKVRELARKHGVKVAITCSDPAMAQYFRDGILEMIGDGVDMLFCNEEEAQLLAGVYNTDEAIEFLKNKTKTFAITLGAKGAIAFDGQTLHSIAPHAVTPIDTNGAGDLFAGAFMYAITHGHDYPSAGRLASAASAQLITQFGPRLNPEQHEPLKQAHLS
ncbi:MAG: adenosine kinase [Venatoribacter sp.]